MSEQQKGTTWEVVYGLRRNRDRQLTDTIPQLIVTAVWTWIETRVQDQLSDVSNMVEQDIEGWDYV